MKSIIFICSNNIYRSAVAARYMQKKVYELDIQNEYFIDSAGISATVGDAVTNYVINDMKRFNVDLESHKARNIDNMDLKAYDLIICFTEMQKEYIIEKSKNLKNKIYTLIEYVDNDIKYINIDEPYGYDKNVYLETNNQIVKYIDKLMEKF